MYGDDDTPWGFLELDEKESYDESEIKKARLKCLRPQHGKCVSEKMLKAVNFSIEILRDSKLVKVFKNKTKPGNGWAKVAKYRQEKAEEESKKNELIARQEIFIQNERDKYDKIDIVDLVSDDEQEADEEKRREEIRKKEDIEDEKRRKCLEDLIRKREHSSNEQISSGTSDTDEMENVDSENSHCQNAFCKDMEYRIKQQANDDFQRLADEIEIAYVKERAKDQADLKDKELAWTNQIANLEQQLAISNEKVKMISTIENLSNQIEQKEKQLEDLHVVLERICVLDANVNRKLKSQMEAFKKLNDDREKFENMCQTLQLDIRTKQTEVEKAKQKYEDLQRSLEVSTSEICEKKSEFHRKETDLKAKAIELNNAEMNLAKKQKLLEEKEVFYESHKASLDKNWKEFEEKKLEFENIKEKFLSSNATRIDQPSHSNTPKCNPISLQSKVKTSNSTKKINERQIKTKVRKLKTCPIPGCGRQFSNRNMYNHKMAHERYTCPHCNTVLKRKDSLDRHVKFSCKRSQILASSALTAGKTKM